MPLLPEIETELSSAARLRGTMEQPLTVSQITELIKLQLESQFDEIVIVGEISNFKAHPSGHGYFSLKDERACIAAVIFRGDFQKLKFKVQDGQKVIAVGRISVYPPRGNYQIVVSRLEPEGMGALQLAFEQLKKKLEAEGFFALERKKAIPRFPRKLGIVTSSSGAALRDILNVLDRRFAGLHIVIYSVRVQGSGSADEISEAIQHFDSYFREEIDVLIVGRGGGSIEDLWAFNEEMVARAIFHCRIPIISAVGHEVDFTIADFVADLRAPTPSAAAELVIGSKLEVIQHLDHLTKRLLQVVKQIEFYQLKADDFRQKLEHLIAHKIANLRLRFEQANGRLFRFSPHMVIERSRSRYENRVDQLRRLIQTLLERKRWQCESQESKLQLLNPRKIMDRGYSIVRLVESGKVVKKASEIRMGDKLLIELSKGRVTAKVSS